MGSNNLGSSFAEYKKNNGYSYSGDKNTPLPFSISSQLEAGNYI
ncbi:unnamed protein product [marine sediment metagenome]|uniref:Uncharacterized protein n=1 Tax=marine sediment metagenome TaxID=412755 RepID=X1NTL8_9ZZZZ